MEQRSVVIDRVLGPQAPHERQRLVEPRRPLPALDAERLLLVCVRDAETESRQQPPARHPIEARHRLRHQDGIASGQHHDARAELQLLGTARGVRHAHDGIGRFAADPFREPQRVEAQSLEVVDERTEPVVVRE